MCKRKKRISKSNTMKGKGGGKDDKYYLHFIPFLEGRLARRIFASSSASCCVGCMHCTYVIKGPRPRNT